jgi:ligand-binding SRPBCC domain-containing protein
MSDLTFTRSIEISAPVEALREWHFRSGAFERLNPPWERAKVVTSPERLVDGALAEIEIAIGPWKRRWIAEHELTDDGFIDRQLEGPFAFWEHQHRFEYLSESTSRLTDSIRYRLPFGFAGKLIGRRFVEAKLDRLFRYRHAVTAEDLSSEGEIHPPNA